jgi:serine/threonine protein kinase
VSERTATPTPGDDAGPTSDADVRMAEILSGSGTGADVRRRLQGESSKEAEDLLGRLNALDFVNAIVGETTDLPERIGQYRVQGLLGRGGMGTVYLAFQEELEREVALKVLSPAWSADPTMRQRFRAEAKATAALHHRHIVPIYDYGEAGGMLFFAMERVDGVSLDRHIAAARRLRRRSMEPLDAARRFAGVADALGLAHRRRMLHRDVKPGNILVSADGTLQLTDFGLAKALDQASVRLTSKGGGFLGTLHYAAPEQLTGRELSPASDLYSLGVTMFEAVAGELPLQGKTTEAMFQSIVYGEPRRLREVLPKPPRDFEAVLEKLLARDPRDRYQDGEALARDLQRIAEGEPVQIRRQSLVVRVLRRARKNPVLSGALAAAAVLLLVTLTLLTVLRREKGSNLESRHQNFLVRIVDAVATSRGDPGGPPPLLACLCGGVDPAPVTEQPVFEQLDQAHAEMPADPQPEAMARALRDDPLPAASSLLREGRGYEALQLYQTAIDAAVQARSAIDLSVELRLYRLYLGRAVANLTAAVARTEDARRDLALASFLRRGAAFPRALADVLSLATSADVPQAARRLANELAGASAEVRMVVGRLLLAVAGRRAAADANLMEFPLSYQDREAVRALALQWFPPEASAAVLAAQPLVDGLASRLFRLAGAVLAQSGNTPRLREELARLRAVLDQSVHPESHLQGWRLVLQVCEQPRGTTAFVGPDGAPLAPGFQVQGFEDLLRLQPPAAFLQLILPRFEAFRRDHPLNEGMARLAASMHLAAGSPQAGEFAQRWVVESTDDPAALACRMRARLLAGRVELALDDAMAVVQNSIDREAARDAVVRACQEAAEVLGPSAREAVLALARTFQGIRL